MMILVIMSHGTNGRILTSEGKSFDVEQIYQMFNNSCCSKLKGKPKFFIIQVSRWLYWHDWSSEAFGYFPKLMILYCTKSAMFSLSCRIELDISQETLKDTSHQGQDLKNVVEDRMSFRLVEGLTLTRSLIPPTKRLMLALHARTAGTAPTTPQSYLTFVEISTRQALPGRIWSSPTPPSRDMPPSAKMTKGHGNTRD